MIAATPLAVRSRRRGMTLIEILVVIAIITSLAAMVMVIAPGALEKDRASAAVTQIEGGLQIQRARAMRDGLPRGIRLIAAGSPQVTSFQYIEVPPIFVFNPDAPKGAAPYAVNAPPFIQFRYQVPAGSVATKECRIYNLNSEHYDLLVNNLGGMLYLPTLGTWHRFTGITASSDNLPIVPPPAAGVPPTTPFYLLTLADYPDAQMGVATDLRVYHFGVYGLPRPLLGEPTFELPRDTCVDLTPQPPSPPPASPYPLALTSPAGTGGDYDILFSPSGQLLNTASSPNTGPAGHVFLWVRDKTKPARTNLADNYETGGEQLIVVIKGKSGAVGAAPVDWGSDPYALARKAVSGN